jgi:hypothetical protein
MDTHSFLNYFTPMVLCTQFCKAAHLLSTVFNSIAESWGRHTIKQFKILNKHENAHSTQAISLNVKTKLT